jgi:hypothetical protein
LAEVADRLHTLRLYAGQRGLDARAVFARAWLASSQEDSMENKHRREILHRTWAWLGGLEESGRAFDQQMRRFAEMYHHDKRLPHTTQSAKTPGQLQRGVVGLADEIDDRMPDAIRRQREGSLQMDWQPTNGWLGGKCSWAGDGESRPLELLPATRRAFRVYAELSAPESEVGADVLLRGLRVGECTLPEFHFKERDGERTRFEWRASKGVEATQRADPSPLEIEKWAQADLPLVDAELNVWGHYPHAADVVRRLLLNAVEADFHESRWETAYPLTDLDRLVETLARLLSRPPEEVIALVAPLLEQHFERECGPGQCMAYARALRHLYDRLNRR